MSNFALTGAAGFVAPRHLRAIRDTGHRLVAACDPHDSVGVLDTYFPHTAFFTEFERFDRHLEKLRRGPEADRVSWVAICSPNHLHDAHVRQALRVGAHALCEKPLVLNPWNLDALASLQAETGRRVYTVLQLRLHPALQALRTRLAADAEAGRRHQVVLTYVTARGPWYRYSWKGDPSRSGGLTTNIGIHLFDLLDWLFGPVRDVVVHAQGPERVAGFLDLARAEVRWLLSIDGRDLPERRKQGSSFRQLQVDGEELEFTEGFADLHTRVYEETFGGRGFGLEDARPSIELTHRLRHSPVGAGDAPRHPALDARRS